MTPRRSPCGTRAAFRLPIETLIMSSATGEDGGNDLAVKEKATSILSTSGTGGWGHFLRWGPDRR